MSLKIHRNILYRMNLLNKGIRLSSLNNSYGMDKLNQNEIYELQAIRLREFMKYAYINCYYYKEMFPYCSVDTSSDDIFSEVRKLPPLTKFEISKNLDSFFSKEFTSRNKLIKKATGGSTGEPFCVWGDKDDYRANGVTIARQRRWLGLVGGMKTLTLFGGFRDAPSRLNRAAKRFLINDRIINIMDRNNADYAQLLERVRSYSPEVLIAYFSSLRELAYAAEEINRPLNGMKLALACAEPVDETGRRHAEKWLGTKIYFQYGNRELGTFAQECLEQKGYHYAQDQAYCEVLDENGQSSEYGDLTITYFGNRVVPLIRYQTGDGAAIDTSLCGCGLPYQRLSVIDGRLASMIKLPDGKRITSNIFPHLFKDSSWILEFQTIQESLNKIKIIVREKRELRKESSLDVLNKKLSDLLGSDITFDWDFNANFEQVPTGKHVNFLSRL